MALIKISRILCPVDLSEQSRRALDYAAMLARWYQSRITALEVIWEPTRTGTFEPLGPAYAADQLERFGAALRRFVESAHVDGVDVSTTVEEGPVAKQIVETARRIEADLIVMGTHGIGGFDHLILGSVTEKVLRKAPCPVLTVPPAAEGAQPGPIPFKTILCGVDFSPSSLIGLTFASSLAQESGGRLIALHVIDWPVERTQAGPLALEVAAFRRQLTDEALRELKAAIPSDARTWCDCSESVAAGKPHEEILRAARENAVDVIVLGVHGRSAVSVAFLGSTTNHVARAAICPVLTIRS